MIDFHAHILPGADHGSDGLETSLAQLRLAERAGVDTVIATPHFYPQTEEIDAFLERRLASWQQLCAAYHGPVRLMLGAEVQMCPGLDHMDELEKLCIEGTNILLLELGFMGWPHSVGESVIRLNDSGEYCPVLAHIDRYNADRIDDLLSCGVLAQLNADAFTRLWGKGRLISWIDSGSVVALGSDIHGTVRGYRNFEKTRTYLKDRFDTVMDRTDSLLTEHKR